MQTPTLGRLLCIINTLAIYKNREVTDKSGYLISQLAKKYHLLVLFCYNENVTTHVVRLKLFRLKGQRNVELVKLVLLVKLVEL